MDTKQLTDVICKVLDQKKAHDINIIDVSDLTIVAENFVIASGNSSTAVKALAAAVDQKLSELSNPPIRTEGMRDGRWAAMDFGNVIVHIFHAETRQFYQLERLWTDGSNLKVFPE